MSKCLSPIKLPNPPPLEEIFDSAGNKLPQSQYQRPKFNVVPCGKCAWCIGKAREEWSFRINEELRQSKSATFLTVTYRQGEETVTHDNKLTLNKRDYQLFLKRLRIATKRHLKKAKINDWPPIRFFLVGEYGDELGRPHFHILLFNVPPELYGEEIEKIWGHGHIYHGKVEAGSIQYCTKYMAKSWTEFKDPKDDSRIPPFKTMSKKPGIGHTYLERAGKMHEETQKMQINKPNGYKGALPRYYANKIFTKAEREQFAAEGQIHTEKALNKRLLAEQKGTKFRYPKGELDYLLESIRIDNVKRKSVPKKAPRPIK